MIVKNDSDYNNNYEKKTNMIIMITTINMIITMMIISITAIPIMMIITVLTTDRYLPQIGDAEEAPIPLPLTPPFSPSAREERDAEGVQVPRDVRLLHRQDLLVETPLLQTSRRRPQGGS